MPTYNANVRLRRCKPVGRSEAQEMKLMMLSKNDNFRASRKNQKKYFDQNGPLYFSSIDVITIPWPLAVLFTENLISRK